ncbi:polysaccharide deacetylase family protein [Bdellovibrio bacteriovorus]|uniref:polysaccharide deacetylase family protein n=1 Tax=Bdellovibrio bacteriovorus TaxID=959 RepID=UPI0035A7058A
MFRKHMLLMSSLFVGLNAFAAGEVHEQTKFAAEMERVSGVYNQIIQDISKSKSGNEFDEHFHKLRAFIVNPGNDKFSNLALCVQLKSLPMGELEYVQSIIESEDAAIALKDCSGDLQRKIMIANLTKKASLNLDADIQKIRRIPFEERTVPNIDYLSMQGLNDKEVMLTFDDGPTQRTTVPILEALKKAGVKAAFFSTGRQALQNKALTQRILQEGHILGSHSFYHTLMMGREVNRGKMSYDYFLSEMIGGHVGVFSSAGYIDPYFRFPNGCMNKNMRRNATELGLKIFGWSIDSFDWQYGVSKYKNDEERRQLILQSFLKALRGSKNRGIVLMHDVFKQSAEALPLILNYLADNGYKVVLLKPENRDMQDRSNLAVVTQAVQFMNTYNIKVTDLKPRADQNGEPVKPLGYEPDRFRYRDMFPQLSYQNSPIDPLTTACEK